MSDLEKALLQSADQFKEEIKKNVERLRDFQYGEKLDWRKDDDYNNLIGAIGETIGNYIPPIALLEAVLKYYKELESETNKALVELLQRSGMEKLTFDDGSEAKISRRYSGTIENEEEFLKWFTEAGYADSLKTVLEFRRGDLTPDVREFIEAKGLSYKESFARVGFPQVLARIIRERIEAGESMPVETVLKVSIMEKAVVK